MAPTHDQFGPMKTVHQTVLIGLTDRVYATLLSKVKTTGAEDLIDGKMKK